MTYQDSPLRNYKENMRKQYGFFSNEQMKDESTVGDNSAVRHISVPRIDMRNPCRWASILHEIGHHELNQKDPDIVKDFKKFIATSDEYRKIYNEVIGENDKKIEQWIAEIWSDLYAALAIGPALWFSQFTAFLFADPKYTITTSSHGDNYPPAYVRLEMVYTILQHRIPLDRLPKSLEDISGQYDTLLEKIYESRTITKVDSERQFIFVLKEFFLPDFKDEHLAEIRKGLNSSVKFSSDNLEIVSDMVIRLESGLPIPTMPSKQDIKDKESISDLPSIILAAWFYRCGSFRSEIISICKKCDTSNIQNDIAIKLMPMFDRFDNSILKSIQVSEWVSLYQKDEIKEETNKSKENKDRLQKKSSLMVDHEILKSLEKKLLHIIPIINLDDQLGAASFDVRVIPPRNNRSYK